MLCFLCPLLSPNDETWHNVIYPSFGTSAAWLQISHQLTSSWTPYLQRFFECVNAWMRECVTWSAAALVKCHTTCCEGMGNGKTILCSLCIINYQFSFNRLWQSRVANGRANVGTLFNYQKYRKINRSSCSLTCNLSGGQKPLESLC